MLSVGRPLSPCGVSLVGVPVVDTGIAVAAVGHVLGAVSSEGVLDDGGVLLVLHGLAEVLHVHVPEVVALGIDYITAVGSDVGPAGEVLLLLLVGYIGQFPGLDVILEAEGLFLHLGIGLGSGGGVLVVLHGLLYRRGNLEGEGPFVLELEILEGNVLGVEGILDDHGQFHSELVHVEYCSLGLGSGIYYPVLHSFGALPLVPELVRVGEPGRADVLGEHHAVDLVRREPLGQVVVGLGYRSLLGPGQGRGQAQQCDDCDNIAFHKVESCFKKRM